MARKRITEADILEYREKADEAYQELAEKYDMLEKAQKAAEDVEERDMGLLILRGADIDMDKVMRFAAAAKAAGFAAEVVDLEKKPSLSNKPEKKIPDWERCMDAAQLGYVMLTEHSRRVAVVGSGETGPTATVIAEQYPADALVVIGHGPQTKAFTSKRTVATLAKVARNNLFSIVCPVYCISPEDDSLFRPGSASLYNDETRSDDVRIEIVAGKSVSGMWTDCEQELETRIFDYLMQL